MVTPYMTSACSMVRLEWVMTTNCVVSAISAMRRAKRPTLVSSSGASTSSSTQKGAGWNWKMPTSSESAVRAFSPPESSRTFCSFLPGGEAMMSMPLWSEACRSGSTR